MSSQEPSTPAADKKTATPRVVKVSLLRRSLRVCAFVLIVLILLLAWFMGTNSGTRFLLASAQFLSHGAVETQGVKGRLADHLELDEFKLTVGDTHIALYGVRLDWRVQALLGARVQVDQLTANRVFIAQVASEQAAQLPVSLSLPVDLHVKQLLLGRLEYASSLAAPQNVSKPQWSVSGIVASLESDQLKHQWRAQLQSAWGSVYSEGEIATAAPFPVKAKYHYSGQLISDIPQVSLKGNVSGNLARLQVAANSEPGDEQTGATPMQAQLMLEVFPFAEQVLGASQLHIQHLDPRWLNADAPQAMLSVDVELRPQTLVELEQADKKENSSRSLKLRSPTGTKKPEAAKSKTPTQGLAGSISIKNTAPERLDLNGLPFKQLTAKVQWAGRSLKIAQARLSLLEGLIEGNGQGDFSVLAQAQLNAKLSVSDVNLLNIDSRLHPTSIRGQIQVQTKEQSKGGKQIDFQAQLNDPLASLQADASLLLGAHPKLHLKTIELKSEQSQLKGQAEFAWGDQAAFKMQGKLSQFDPARWVKAPQGRLDGEFVAAGTWEPEWQVQLHVPRVSGELAGQLLNGVAQVQWQEQRLLKVDQMQWQWGRNTLQANGNLGADKDELRLSLAIDEPHLLTPFLSQSLSGRANLQATLRGQLTTPSVETQVQAEDVQWGRAAKLGYLKANASLGAGANAALNLQLHAQHLRWNLPPASGTNSLAKLDESQSTTSAMNSLREFRLDMQGSRAAHQIAAQAQWDGGQSVSVKASGKLDVLTWSAPAWSGRVDAAQLMGVVGAAEPDLVLRESGLLSWSRDKVAVGAVNLQGQLGQINLEHLEWTPRSLSSKGHWQGLPALAFIQLSKARERVQGDLKLALVWDLQLKEHLAAKFAVRRQSGDVSVLDADGTGQKMPLGLSEVMLDASSKGLIAGSDAEKIELTAQAKGTRLGMWSGKLNSQLRRDGVHWTWDSEMPLAGDVHVQMNELQWLASQVSSELVSKGQLKMDAEFSGKFSHPKYQAKIEGHGLEFAFATEGLLFPNGELKAVVTDEILKLEQLRFTNTLSFVPKIERLQDLNWAGRIGEFDASGEVNWRLQQGAIAANWKNFPLLQRKDRWLVVSGQAGITQTDKAWTLAGKLAADAAYFRLPKMPPPSLSNDVLVSRELKLTTGEEDAANKFAVKAKFDLQLDMGSRFVFVGRGLDTALSGVLRLRGSDSSPVYASGAIATSGGQYEGYGQQLEIERGILNFQGSALNPALNIRALRKGLPVEAGVDVTGTVANPQVRLVSEPNVPDNEKVSWLVLGRGPDQFATADASLLLSAAGAILGGDGSRNFPRELARGLGFDEFSIGPAESGGSSKLPNQTVAGAISVGAASNDQVVSIGKRFKPGIVLSVERGVSDASNALKLSWQLGRRIRLVGRKGTDDAVDVKYSFSFN